MPRSGSEVFSIQSAGRNERLRRPLLAPLAPHQPRPAAWSVSEVYL